MLFYIYISFIILIFIYYVSQFLFVLIRLKDEVILPTNAQERESIRKEPQKPVKPPTYSGQKNGIIFYSLILVYVIALSYAVWVFEAGIFAFLLVLMPLFYSSSFLNLFAFTSKGILSGVRFVSWNRIKHYELLRIDVNHKYYGHAKEVNDQYELQLHTKFRSLNCIITADHIKDNVLSVLAEKGIGKKAESAQKHHRQEKVNE